MLINKLRIYFITFVASGLALLIYIFTKNSSKSLFDEKESTRRLNINWGKPWPYTLESPHLNLSCSWNNGPMCCGLVDPSDRSYPRHKSPHYQEHQGKMSNFHTKHSNGHNRTHCQLTKKYVPSIYEQQQIHMAWTIANSSSDEEIRRNSLLEFLMKDIDDSNKWLNRVAIRMKELNLLIPPTEEDLQYLSRFEVTKTCTNNMPPETWLEWIEPISIHARHPFTYAHCPMPESAKSSVNPPAEYLKHKDQIKYPVGWLCNVDYILLQHGENLRNEAKLQSKTTKHYLFDAGSDTFDSSLYWFTCSYLQRQVAFDRIYGFEATLLEPIDFWKRTPPKIAPLYHFYNAPVSNLLNSSLSVLRIIQEMANKDDFVSFKLDIDSPNVEIPIVLDLLRRPEFHSIVDEFFFELHFQCELLGRCAWGPCPDYFEDLRLDRPHALELFQQLRFKGIRSHFWP